MQSIDHLVCYGKRLTAARLRLEHERVKLTRSCSANELSDRVIHVSGDSASDDHALGPVYDRSPCLQATSFGEAAVARFAARLGLFGT